MAYLLLLLIPLIIYFVLDLKGKFKEALYFGTATAWLIFIVYSFLTKFDASNLIEPIGFTIFALVSLKMNKPHLFRWQPIGVGIVLVAILVIMELQGSPLFVRYIPQMMELMDEQSRSQLQEIFPVGLQKMLSRDLIYLLIAHMLLIIYTIPKKSSWPWFLARLAIYPLFIIMVIVDFIRFNNQ